jgi:hypothetical protein
MEPAVQRTRGARAALVLVALAWIAALVWQRAPTVVERGSSDGVRAMEQERLFAVLAELTAGVRHHSEAHHGEALQALERRLVAAGHEPLRQEARHLAVPVVNLLARAAGEASTGLVVVMAHHDSVFGSPGASDDGAGTAAALEAFLAVTREPHRNDVALLLTDGEELDLHGARAFVERHPWFEEVRAVVNLESLGNAGPAWLFETGREDGRWIVQWADAAPLPIGSSIAEPIYRTLMSHRDTDFSPFRDSGIGGFNFATVWGTSANHRPYDTFDNVDKAAVVHLFESGRAALAVLANADLLRVPAPEPVFFELPFAGLVVLPAWTSRVLSLLALVAALFVMLRRTREVGAGRAALGLAGGLVCLAAALGLAVLAARGAYALVERFDVASEPVGNVLSMRWFAAGVASVAAGTFAALASRLRLATAWFLAPWALALVALEWRFSEGAHQAALPLFAGACAALALGGAHGSTAARTRLLAAPLVAFAVLFLGPLLRTLPQIVSYAPTFAALAGALPGAALAALALCAARDGRHTRSGLVLAVLGCAALATAAAIAATGR